MKEVPGFYFDGRRSERHGVMLECVGGELRIMGGGIELRYPLKDVELSSPLAGVQRSLHLPKGGMCQLADDADWKTLLGKKERTLLPRLLDRWERSLPLALLALFLTCGAVAVFIGKVIPAVVRHVALAVSPASELRLGKETLRQLDHVYLNPTKLPKRRQRELAALFGKLCASFPEGRGYRLELRDGAAIGANAFALPGGTIVLTDAMVKLAGRDEELLAVLAHEAGHERNRHALRHLLQASGAGLIIAALTGDITSISSLAAPLPATLINARYSRAFEYEADDAAVAYLLKAGISPRVFADILGRLEAQRSHKEGEEERNGSLNLFEDHPSTAERIKRILAAGKGAAARQLL